MNEIGSEIRVFARRTKWTPTDDLAFYDEPPLYELPDLTVMVSVTFTWDKEKGQRLALAWARRSKRVRLGGPAFDDPGIDFIPGRFIKLGVTFTSRGCPKHCSYCLVPKREGKLREIRIRRGHIVQDNNLLACSRNHLEAVFEMLKQQKRGIVFSGGLDIDYLQEWHIERFKQINLAKSGLWVACDRPEHIARLDKARDLLSDFSIEKKRCYVLVGENGDTIQLAQERCRAVLRKGFLPYAQLYRSPQASPSRGGWREFCYYWSSPRLYRKKEGIE